MSRFEVYVVPLSSNPGPDGRHGGLPRLRVKSPPTGGRANGEAEKTLSDLLRVRVRLVAGGRSRRKVFEADETKSVMDLRLVKAFGR